VLVLTDDQRWDTFGFLGKPWLPTPNLDALAAGGAYGASHFVTTSLCCPSRATMFTGLYAHAHGVLDNTAELDPAVPTWQAIARRAGVRTVFLGKWHMGGANPHPRPDWDRWIGFRGQGQYHWPGPPGQDPLDRAWSVDGEMTELQGYVTDLLTDLAIEELRSPAMKEPFVLVVSHKACHAPFEPAPRHRDLLRDMPIPKVLPDTDAAYAELPAWLREMRRHTMFGVENLYGHAWPDFASWIRDYHRTILAVDDSVGRIVAALDEHGLRDHTAVIYTSDNGFMFGEKGVLDKRNFYDPSARVPFVAQAPGLIPGGRAVDRFTLNVDLAPTVLDLLGLEAPPSWQGRSLVPVLRGDPVPDWRQEFVYEYFFERAYPSTPTVLGLRTKKLKLSTYHGIDTSDELFDLEADPGETDNRIDDPSYADQRQALRARLRRHADDLGLRWDPIWGTGPNAAGKTGPFRGAKATKAKAIDE
jgi:arylsulfatase A-like enzyme